MTNSAASRRMRPTRFGRRRSRLASLAPQDDGIKAPNTADAPGAKTSSGLVCTAVTGVDVDVARPHDGNFSSVLHRDRQDRRSAPAAGGGICAGRRALAEQLFRGFHPRRAGRGVLRIQLRAFDAMGGLSVRRLPNGHAGSERDRRAADRGAIGVSGFGVYMLGSTLLGALNSRPVGFYRTLFSDCNSDRPSRMGWPGIDQCRRRPRSLELLPLRKREVAEAVPRSPKQVIFSMLMHDR